MADFPQSIDIGDAKLAKLTATYQQAYEEIYAAVATSTQFGAYRRKQILNQINAILRDLGDNTHVFIEEVIPEAYKTGSMQAVQQLDAANLPVEVKSGFNKIHQDAIAALVDDTAAAFGQSISGVGRSAKQLMSQATKDAITQELATGQISGDALKTIQAKVAQHLQNQGLDALVDKGGHAWSLDRYTEMLIRTKTVEARNTGLQNRLVENGYDLVQVSAHGATDVCGPWEGEILSMTGATPGYPTVDNAMEDGLFHPNCKHALNGLTPDLALQTYGYDATTGEYVQGRIDD